uniref:VAN3-binding protein-like auxin canalisation domain-containing protein n=1 Tax=Leersia perrieri TaxID=77586 RepID=A0A0D9XMP9_9ORYZ
MTDGRPNSSKGSAIAAAAAAYGHRAQGSSPRKVLEESDRIRRGEKEKKKEKKNSPFNWPTKIDGPKWVGIEHQAHKAYCRETLPTPTTDGDERNPQSAAAAPAGSSVAYASTGCDLRRRRLYATGQNLPIDVQNATIQCKEKLWRSKCCHPADMPIIPLQAMEFFSRTWGPSSSNLFEVFSPSTLGTSSDDHQPEKCVLASEMASPIQQKAQAKATNLGSRLTSAVKTGLERCSLGELLTLTASAATCLRGAAALKLSADIRCISSSNSMGINATGIQKGSV